MRESGPWLALVVLLAVCCLSSESFRQPQNLLNIMRQVSYSGIIALGMTLIIIGGGIDLAVGSLLALSGVLGIMAMNQVADPLAGLLLGAGVAFAVGVGGGALNGLLVAAGRIPPFIATLGTLSIFRSLALYAADAGLVSSGNDHFRRLGAAAWCGVPVPVWVLLRSFFRFCSTGPASGGICARSVPMSAWRITPRSGRDVSAFAPMCWPEPSSASARCCWEGG